MNLEDALRCLFLRHLRADRLAAVAAGESKLAARIESVARALAVERDKTTKEYRVTLEGTAWQIPETEFTFYTRGDRLSPSTPTSADDAQYEQNLCNARKWLQTFLDAVHA